MTNVKDEYDSLASNIRLTYTFNHSVLFIVYNFSYSLELDISNLKTNKLIRKTGVAMTKKPYTYNQLNILNSVLEEGSYTQAAKRLGVSQSAISQAISTLENNLGFKLFMQRGRHLVPTDYCLELGSLTSKIREVEDDLEQLIQRSKIFEAAVLKVGLCSPMPGTEIIRQFNKLYPKLQTEIYFGNFQETFNRVIDGQVDVGILANVPMDDRLQLKKCATQRLVALCSPNHPFASRESISLNDLASETVIFRTQGSNTQKLINKALDKINLSLTPTYIVNTQESVYDAVYQNLGVGFAWSESATRKDGFVKVSIDELPSNYDEVLFSLKDTNNSVVTALMSSLDKDG